MRIRPKTGHFRAIFHGVLIGCLLLAGLALPVWAADDDSKSEVKSIGLLPPPRPASPHK